MHCKEVEALLYPYLDGEMTLSDTRLLEQHIKKCSSCGTKLKEREALHEAIISLGEERVPRKLKKEIDKKIDELTDDGEVQSRWLWWALPTVGMTIGSSITAVIMMFVIGLPSHQDVRDPFIDAHISSLMVDHITDVTSTDKHTVKPWFSGKLSFSPTVHKINMKDLELLGGRLDFINDKTTASVVYKLRSHIINVFIQKSENNSNDELLKASHISSYNMVAWYRNGLLYRAVSDLNKKELNSFSHKFSEQ